VIVLFLALYGVAAAALSIAEHHIGQRETGMIDLMFESMSALSTTGVSTGITPALTVAGKLVLCATMFLGRLGPLTAVYALQRRQRPEKYRFPEEAVRIG
jgi:trk system potassium uptake protein